jgi:hypothetical protein
MHERMVAAKRGVTTAGLQWRTVGFEASKLRLMNETIR